MKSLRRYKSLFVLALVACLLFGALVVGKNIFLAQVRKKLETSFLYSTLRLSYVPPAIVLEGVRSRTGEPFFSAPRVRIGISYLSLFRKEKPLTFTVDEPVLRMSSALLSKSDGRRKSFFPLPFAIDKGLVRGGEIDLTTPEGDLTLREVKALFRQREDAFDLHAVSAVSFFPPGLKESPLEGTLNLGLSAKGEDLTVHRAVVEGQGFMFKIEGRVRNLLDPEIGLRTSFNIETAYLAKALDLPFVWEGRAAGEGRLERRDGTSVFEGEFATKTLVLSGVPMEDVRGRFRFRGPQATTVEAWIQKRSLPPESLTIEVGDEKVEGTVRQVFLDPLMTDLKVPWPVLSPVWGTFTIDKKTGRVEALGEFRDTAEEPDQGRYPFRGQVKLLFDQKNQDLVLSSDDIHSSFGDLQFNSRSTIGKDIRIGIRGGIRDVRQAREFTSLVLLKTFPFPEIRGAGNVDIAVEGDYIYPRVTAVFGFGPGGFDLFEAASVKGTAEIVGNDFRGDFDVYDPSMKGQVHVFANLDRVETEIRNGEGLAEKILPALRIPFPLHGPARGNFKVIQTLTSEAVSGDFRSPGLTLFGQRVEDVQGRLEWKDGNLSFPEIRMNLRGGTLSGRAAIGTLDKAFDVDLRGQGIDLSLFYPRLKGLLSLSLAGRGVFGKDRLGARFEVGELFLPPFQKTALAGTAEIDYPGDEVRLGLAGGFSPGDNTFEVGFKIPLKEDALSADIKGHFTNFDLLLPWTGAKGRLNYLGELRGTKSSPRTSGVVDFQGAILPFPRFAHALTDFSGLAFFQDGRVSVRSFAGKLGGGDVRVTGELHIGPDTVDSIDLSAEGKNMLLSPLERTRALAEGSARLVKDSRRFLLEGNFLINQLTWRREIYEPFGFSSLSLYETRREPQFFDDLNLNLRIRGEDNIRMQNSLGWVDGRFDLTVTGNISSPILLGEIQALDGEVEFQDRTFKVLKGRLNFFNPVQIEPYIEIKGESYVKDYRVTITLSGLANNVRPELSSSPPLPSEDILALLALGEAFRRTYSYDTTTTLSTASLLSFQIAEQAKRRAEGLFSLARFRIDPFVMGSSAEMTARLTVGRKISRNLSVLYSTNLTAQREEIVRMEWEISNEFSLVGIRNERGRLSFDLKVRKRF